MAKISPISDHILSPTGSKNYTHDCDKCVFCGTIMILQGSLERLQVTEDIDVYFCPSDRDEVIMRMSDEGSDYASLRYDLAAQAAQLSDRWASAMTLYDRARLGAGEYRREIEAELGDQICDLLNRMALTSHEKAAILAGAIKSLLDP